MAFRAHLLDSLVDYSSAKNYDNATVYETGDFVKWDGVIKIVIVDDEGNTQTTTGNIPDDICYWKDADRFSSKCLNTAWCSFIGPYLAWVAIRANAPFFYAHLTAQGIVINKGSNFDSVDIKNYSIFSAAVKREITTAFDNMDYYMKNNNNVGCFDLYKGISETCCSKCGLVDCTCGCSCSGEDSCGCDECNGADGDYEYTIA